MNGITRQNYSGAYYIVAFTDSCLSDNDNDLDVITFCPFNSCKATNPDIEMNVD